MTPEPKPSASAGPNLPAKPPAGNAGAPAAPAAAKLPGPAPPSHSHADDKDPHHPKGPSPANAGTGAGSLSGTGLTVLTQKDYKGTLPPVWCPGCGDFGVLSAMQRALADKQLQPEDVVFVSGIGCSSRFPHFMKAYGFHAVHGRALPVATGVKLAAPNAKVIVVGGDGDGMAIGAGHFVHTARRNPNILYVMMDNEIYGLTKGQVSPTSEMGLKTKSTPYVEQSTSADSPISPLALAILSGATFVARVYSGKIKEMVDILGKALDHDGYAFIQAISPCVTFNDTYDKVKGTTAGIPADHDATDKFASLALAMKDPYSTGVFYEQKRQTLDAAVELQKAMAAKKSDTGLAGLAKQILATA